MANPEHLANLKEGVEAWNRWRKENPAVTPNLLGADLRCEGLSGADLSGVDLGMAGLGWANLSGADLSDATLCEANLREANLSEAILDRANLAGANLCLTNLNEASLDQTDLTGARVGSTVFANVDLSGVKGLETLEHLGPSSIAMDTIYRSKGKIPHTFLRGAGVPEDFIQYIPALVGIGIEFYSLFISYSTKDQEFADRLHADLQAKGVRCWYAPADMPGGKKLHEEIDAAIRVHDKLLLILSLDSMNSEWVKREISVARRREIVEGRQILIPVRVVPFESLLGWVAVDAGSGTDSAREVREYYIPDFSNWKEPDSYKRAFSSLLRVIATSSEPGAGPDGGRA